MTDEEVAKALDLGLQHDKDGALRYIGIEEGTKSNLSINEFGRIKYLILAQVAKEQEYNYQTLLQRIINVKKYGNDKIVEEVREWIKDQENSVKYKQFEVKHHRKGKWTKEGELI